MDKNGNRVLNRSLRSLYWEDRHWPAQTHQYTRHAGDVHRLLDLRDSSPSKQLELKLKQIGHRCWQVGYKYSSRHWDLASSLSHKTPFFRKWHLNVSRATSMWLSDTFCNLDSTLFALYKCQHTDFLAEEAGSTPDWTINLPADMASNFS